MKTPGSAASKLAVALVLISSLAYAERGRTRIERGTVMTDKGTNLRGRDFLITSWFPPEQENSYKTTRDLGLNTAKIRFEDHNTDGTDPPVAGKPWCWQDYTDYVDKTINWTAKYDLHCIINYSTCMGCGTSGGGREEFWDYVIPKAAGRSHVLFEISNEAYDPVVDIEIHHRIKNADPNARVILFSRMQGRSFSDEAGRIADARSKGVDFSTCYMGWHDYGRIRKRNATSSACHPACSEQRGAPSPVLRIMCRYT